MGGSPFITHFPSLRHPLSALSSPTPRPLLTCHHLPAVTVSALFLATLLFLTTLRRSSGNIGTEHRCCCLPGGVAGGSDVPVLLLDVSTNIQVRGCAVPGCSNEPKHGELAVAGQGMGVSGSSCMPGVAIATLYWSRSSRSCSHRSSSSSAFFLPRISRQHHTVTRALHLPLHPYFPCFTLPQPRSTAPQATPPGALTTPAPPAAAVWPC